MKNKHLTALISISLCVSVIVPDAFADTVGICVTKKTGALKGVLNATKCNKKTEVFLSLNSTGVAGIQGTPGAKGDTGSQGIPGAKGDPGTPGSGSSLKVYDANNQFLGYAISPGTIYIPALDVVAGIQPVLGVQVWDDSTDLYIGNTSPSTPDLADLIQSDIAVKNYAYDPYDQQADIDGMYASLDCTGISYGHAMASVRGNILVRHYSVNPDGSSSVIPNKYYVRKYEPAIQVVVGSKHHMSTGGKGNVPVTPAYCQAIAPGPAVWVRPSIGIDTEVTLPFTTPFLLPLRYEIN